MSPGRGRVWLFQRGLFWRVYLTLLASLAATAILGAVIWHLALGRAGPMPVSPPGAALGALLPGPEAPRADLEALLARVSSASGGRILLLDRNGRVVAAADNGRAAGAGMTGRAIRLSHLGPWRARLADGRSLWIETLPRQHPEPAHHMLLMLLTASAVIGLFAYPVVARLTRRLETLRARLDDWGAGALETRAPVEGGDEVAAVAMSFNAAAERVERLLDSHRTLLAHASHELRSPLTRLRVAVEMLVARPEPELLPGVIADIAELDALVDEILLASRLEQGAATAAPERVDLLALAAEEAACVGASLDRSGSNEPSCEVQGSPRLLRRMIRNLLENAARHGAPPIEIDLSSNGGSVTLRVSDRGPGIAEAERQRVFQPFYRPSDWSEAAGSWGLGLSIVRQIAERHGGSVACEARSGGGAMFVVVLPAAA